MLLLARFRAKSNINNAETQVELFVSKDLRSVGVPWRQDGDVSKWKWWSRLDISEPLLPRHEYYRPALVSRG